MNWCERCHRRTESHQWPHERGYFPRTEGTRYYFTEGEGKRGPVAVRADAGRLARDGATGERGIKVPDKHEVDETIAALQQIYHLRRVESHSEADLTILIEQVIVALANSDEGPGKYGGIRKTVADAMARTYLNRTLDDLIRTPSRAAR